MARDRGRRRSAFLGCILAASLSRAAAQDRLLLVDDAFGVVWTFDAATGEALRGFSLPRQAIGNTLPRGQSALAYDGNDLYYTSRATPSIWVLDPQTGALRRTLAKPTIEITELGAFDGVLFAVTAPLAETGGRLGAFYRIDASSGEVLEEREIPGLRDAFAYAAERDSYYFRIGTLEVREVDVETFAPTRSATPPAAFVSLAYDAAGGVLYGLTESCLLYRLDAASLEVEGLLPLADPHGGELFLCGGLVAAQITDPPEDPFGGIPPGPDEPPAVFAVQDLAIPAGASERVPVVLTTTLELEGYVVAAVHDPTALALEAIHIDGTDTERVRPDFVATELFPNGGTLGVVFDLIPPFEGTTLPPGQNYVIAAYRYTCIDADVAESATTEVRLLDGVIGDPPKRNIVIVGGRSIRPFLLPGRITCEPRALDPGGPRFLCGGPPGRDGLPSSLELDVGAPVELCLYYAYPEPRGDIIQGLSMALAFDCRLACIEGTFRAPEESVLTDVDPDFVEFNCESDPEDGDGCEMVFAVLVETRPPFAGDSLPRTATPLLLACVDLRLTASLREGQCLDIRFRDNINGAGRVPIKNVVALDNHSVTPVTEPCQVCAPRNLVALLCGGRELDARNLPLPALANPGEEVEVCFWYSSPGEPVHALVEALRFDCRLECIEDSFEVDPSLEALVGPMSFEFRCENDPGDGDPCEMVLRVLPASGSPPDLAAMSPANVPRRFGCVRVRVAPDVPPGTCLQLEHHDGADVPGGEPAFNRIEIDSGVVEPQVIDCLVCVPQTRRPYFICGGSRLGPDGLPEPVRDVVRGEAVELCFWYCSPVDPLSSRDEIQGLSMAVCFDCRMSCLEETFRMPLDSITSQLDAEFVEFHCENDPRDGDGCEMIFGLLVDFLPPFDGRTLPPTDLPLKLFCVDMLVSPHNKLGFCLPVEFCDNINGRRLVPIKNLVSIQNHSVSPDLVDCEVCIEFLGPKFLCGAIELGPDNRPLTPGGFSGGPAEVCFYYTSPRHRANGEPQTNPLQGLVMAVSFDCRLRCLPETLRFPETAATTLYGPPDYVQIQCDDDPTDGDGCEMILAILMDTEPPFDARMLPPTDDPLLVACVDFLIPEGRECGECFGIFFTNGIDGTGRIPLFNQVAVDNRSFLADTCDCQVCVVEPLPEPEFRRGDCDGSGEVDLADAAHIIAVLFAVGPWRPEPICLDACDVNDDGRVDLADAHAILRYLFMSGPPPPAPGPEVPGPDPTADKLACPIVDNPCPLPGVLPPRPR
jgi:hypothetical protein